MVEEHRKMFSSTTRMPSGVKEPTALLSSEGKGMLYHLNTFENSFKCIYEMSMEFIVNSGPSMVEYNNPPRGFDRCSLCFRHSAMASYIHDMEYLCASCIVITEWPEILFKVPLSHLVFPISVCVEMSDDHKTFPMTFTSTEMSNGYKTFLEYYNCTKSRFNVHFKSLSEVINNDSERTHEEIAYALMKDMPYPRGNNHHFMMPKIVLDCLRFSMPDDLIFIILRYILMRY